MTTYKLDLFKTLLPAIDRRDLTLLDRLTVDERAGFSPTVALRAASGIRDGANADLMLLLLNARANMNFYDISDHPDLQYQLIASSGPGHSVAHQWIPMAQRKRSSGGLYEFLSKYWPDANQTELDLLVGQFTQETYKDFVFSCGLSPKDTDAALVLFDKHHGIEAPSGKRKKGKSKS